VLKLGAAGLAALLAFVPRRREPRQVVALAAAVMIAVQLPAVHWFYFYLVWIAPLVLAAVMSAYRGPAAHDAAHGVDTWSRPTQATN
jgi:hypothetical protein